MLALAGFAETYRFEPTEFYNTFSGAHKPALRIKPGDHVITSTYESFSKDEAGIAGHLYPDCDSRDRLGRDSVLPQQFGWTAVCAHRNRGQQATLAAKALRVNIASLHSRVAKGYICGFGDNTFR